MRLLLDENLPKKLKTVLRNHEVYTAFEKGWASKKNGELLSLMVAENFGALLTFDKNLQYQQNFKKYPILVLVLVAPDNTFDTLQHLIPRVNQAIERGQIGPVIIR